MTIGDRVRTLRTARRQTQAELAAAVRRRGGDLSQSQLSAIERDEVDRPGALVELAAELETTESYLLGKSAISPSETPPTPFDPALEVNAVRAPDAKLPPYRSEMPKDVPVYGTVVGGEDSSGDFELNGNVGDYVRRPPRIAGRADVFALFVQGDSMQYWRVSGQLIYVERLKPPSTLDYVLVELKPRDHDNVRPALVKQLLAITPTKVRLRQYNPAKDFDIDRRTVLHLYRIMDWDELLGV